MNKKKSKKQCPKYRKTILDDVFEHFAQRINQRKYINDDSCHNDHQSAYILPIRNIKYVKLLLVGKRGIKVCSSGKCAFCGSYVQSHWTYKISDGTYLHLCNNCKQKIKPSPVISSIVYNSFETNKQKH